MAKPQPDYIAPMGYDLHITRRDDWTDDGEDISLEEFVQHVQADKEFTYPGQNGDDYADWINPKTGYQSWLCWSDGQIFTKNPEEEFIDKMVVIARALSAEVQGDDGEVYLSATEIRQQPNAPPAPAPAPDRPTFALSQWPLWKRMVAAFLLGCILLGLKLLIFGG